MNTNTRQLAINAGRAYLRQWFAHALDQGEIWYDVSQVSRSGMSRQIKLFVVRPAGDGSKATILPLWPSLPNRSELEDQAPYSELLDVVAKDWGFNFECRTFRVKGCGMDMVFALIYDLSLKAYSDLQEAARVANLVKNSL